MLRTSCRVSLLDSTYKVGSLPNSGKRVHYNEPLECRIITYRTFLSRFKNIFINRVLPCFIWGYERAQLRIDKGDKRPIKCQKKFNMVNNGETVYSTFGEEGI